MGKDGSSGHIFTLLIVGSQFFCARCIIVIVLREHIWRGTQFWNLDCWSYQGISALSTDPFFLCFGHDGHPFISAHHCCSESVVHRWDSMWECEEIVLCGLVFAVLWRCCVAVISRCWTALPSAPIHKALLLRHTLFPPYGRLKHSGKSYFFSGKVRVNMFQMRGYIFE